MSDNIDIIVKSSADKKFNLNVSPSLTVSQLKENLASQCDIPADRQRLIFSGRVLKDNDTLESCKITKSGQTIHLVRGAAPPQSSSSTSTTSSTTPSSTNTNTGSQVPSNISAGTGSGNLLADLTGARYAGFANLPSANMFGPDGGMGPAPNADDILRMMDTPGFSEGLEQALQNPAMVDMMINANPQLRDMGPQFRQMLQSDEFRQMLTNPQMLRQIMQMERMFGSMRNDQTSSFPAPGAPASETNAQSDNNNTNDNTRNSPNTPNPANPFAALLSGGVPFGNNGPSATGPDPSAYAGLFNAFLGGAGSNAQSTPQEPADNRPPEERYESQLRQLNELGFVDFDRNVRALRRAGGNVQGAVEALLDGQV